MTTSHRKDRTAQSTPAHRELLDRLHAVGRSVSPLRDFVPPLAALLVLRWAAFVEAEHEAIASFDETGFSSLLPHDLRQPAWSDPDQFATRVVQALDRIDLHENVALFKYTRAVAPSIRECAARDGELLRLLISWVLSFAFETSEGRQDTASAFEGLLARVVQAQGKFGGEFTTPQPVVELMLEIADPKPGDRVYDPCFGVGGLLVAAARHLRTASDSARRWNDIGSNGIFGVEINSASFSIGLCRVVLAGIERPGLELGDALERPLPRNRAIEGFDCILAAPPWGTRVAETKTRQYQVRSTAIENVFLQHVMANLRQGGRAVIALPQGTLFRTGPDKQVRRALLSDFRVDAVVSLPEGAFSPCTSIPSSLVVFRREPPRRNVRFVRIAPKAWPAAPRDGFEYEYATPSGKDVLALHQGLAEGLKVMSEVTALVRHGSEFSPQGLEKGGLEVWEASNETLAARDYELIAKRTGADGPEKTLERLRAADPTLQVFRLDEVAGTIQGVSYDRKLTTERRQGDIVAPLIRVGDVLGPHIKAPTLFFMKGAAARIREVQRLRRGDILITTSGTVGKVGVVTDDPSIVGAIATKSVVVVRPTGPATSDYLLAILQAPEYQDWILGHARGSTIQHLSVHTLRRLPIPVPSVPVQDAVLRNLSTGGDALGLLVRYITGGTSDPLANWLERPGVVSLIAPKGAPSDAAKMLSDVGRELQELLPVRNNVAHARQVATSGAVTRWILKVVEAAPILIGIDDIPVGASRLSALQLAKIHIDEALGALVLDDSAIAVRLRAVTTAIARLAEQEASKMLGPVSVRLRAEPSEIIIGKPNEVVINVQNCSTAGLRSVRVLTRPDFGTGEIPYLSEGASAVVPLTVKGSIAGQPLRISVRWTAVRLDGVVAHGEEPIELLVLTTREAVLAGDLGASPYIVGNPVDREEMFYGREDIIERIQQQLGSTTNANVILLEGNRRTGKTSVLKQLQKKGVLSGWVIVYCNFQEAEGDTNRPGISTRDVYRFLTRAIGWTLFSVGIRTWFPNLPPADPKKPFPTEFLAARDRAICDDHPFESFDLYLAAALEAARPRRILLMLDEFDKLQEGIDAGVTSPQVPENIRHILQHRPGLSAILTGSRRLKRLREEYWSALFGLGYRVEVGSLPLEDARRLVTEPVADRLKYLTQARDRLVELCAAQPFLVQSLCNRIFERAALSGERTVTITAVNEAAIDMVRENEHFRTLWDYAKTHRRRLLLALCERFADGPDAVNLEFLFTKLEASGLHVPRQSVIGDDLSYLRELELLEFDKSYRGGTYRIAVPLLGMWIHESIDFDDAVARAREEAQEP